MFDPELTSRLKATMRGRRWIDRRAQESLKSLRSLLLPKLEQGQFTLQEVYDAYPEKSCRFVASVVGRLARVGIIPADGTGATVADPTKKVYQINPEVLTDLKEFYDDERELP